MLWWTIQNLAVAAVLAALAWAICRSSRIGPVGRHALWLVVLVKLLTPPLLAWPWAVGDPGWHFGNGGEAKLAANMPTKPANAAHDAAAPRADVPPASFSSDVAIVGGDEEYVDPALDAEPDLLPDANTVTIPQSSALAPANSVASSLDEAKPTDPTAGWPAWLLPVIGITWLAGALVFASLEALRIRRMLRRLRGSTPADATLARHVADLARRIGVSPPRVRVLSALGSPAMFAFGRPLLLWPAELPAAGNDSAIRGLIAHELAHVRRRDHWVGWLELAAGVLWWWNPLFWYVRHQLRENAELACDGWVVKTLPGGRRAYAEGLLNVCESMHRAGTTGNPMPAVGVNTGGRKFLERRLAMIMNGNVPLRLPRAGLWTIAVLAMTALPAWSQQRGEEIDHVVVVESTTPKPATPAPGGEGRDPLRDRASGYLSRTLINAQVPADAQKVLDQLQQQKAAATQDAIAALQKLQERYAAAGQAREAAVVAARIRQLQDDIGARRTGIGVAGPTALPDPGTLIEYRDKVGQSFYFRVTGATEGSTVWGDGIYTDDSPLAVAAVHSGAIRAMESAIVRVDILPGMNSYIGSTRNGINTQPYGEWQGSYHVVRAESPSGFAPIRSIRRFNAKADPGNLVEYRDKVGQSFWFDVTGSTDGTIWGSGVYTDDSSLATAAVHAGILKSGERGIVKVTIQNGRDSYDGASKNGVNSAPYGSWPGSFTVESAGAYNFTVPADGTIRPRGYGDVDRLRGNGPTTVAPVPSPNYGFGARPKVLREAPDLSQFRGERGVVLYVDVTGSTEGPVWGTGVYTDDSSLAAAAVHAGLLKAGERGVLRVTVVPGRSEYAGSESNGVSSHDYAEWGGSYRIDKTSIEPAGTGPVPPPILRLRTDRLIERESGGSAKDEDPRK